MKISGQSKGTASTSRKRGYERPKIQTFDSKDLVKILGAAQALSSSSGGGGGSADSLIEPVYRGRGGSLNRR